MEQVLSSPRGHSDWESDQNSLGFLLLDNDDDVAADGGHENPERRHRGEPGIVSLSFDEIFQDSSLNLDEFFRASRYSGLDQACPWERGSDCVSPSWDIQPSLPQKPAREDCREAPHGAVTADLISFNSNAPSPTHTCTSMQAVDISQPTGTVDTDCPLDGLIGQLPLDPVMDQTLSQTLPAQRTSVTEETPDSHWTKDLTSSQTTPEDVTDILCANLLDLAAESSSRTASYSFENSNEALITSPFIYDLSSSLQTLVSCSDALDEVSPMLFLESPVQPCDGSLAIFQTVGTTVTGLSSEQEREVPSISNTIRGDASEVQSPAGPLASSKPFVQERTLAGSDSEAKPETPNESVATGGPPETSRLGLSDEDACEDEEIVEMEEVAERDIPPHDPVVQELQSDFTQAVLLFSPTFVPEQTAPVQSTSTSPVSLCPQTDVSPEYSNDELRVNTQGAAFEKSPDLNENSNLSVISDSHFDDVHNAKLLASEKEIIIHTIPALKKEPPPVSPLLRLTLEANAETDAISHDSESETHTSSEIESKRNPSESLKSPEGTGEEQTINMPNMDTSDTLAALDTHFHLHVQEVESVHTSVNGTTQHCQDPNGCTAEINQQPNTQDESESFGFSAHNCTPEKFVTPKDIHATSDDLQDTHRLTESSDGSVNTHTPDFTPVSKENTFLCALLPAQGSIKAEEGIDREPVDVTYTPESVPGPLDSTLLSGADSPLSQVGVAIGQERGAATSRLCQSADVKLDGETDLPEYLRQADLSQVAEPKLNSLRDESPSGVCPLEETCPLLMEDSVVVPDGPDNAEMALELCVSSDMIQDGCSGAGALPAANPQDDEHSALRAVFQALDQDGDGFVRIEEFMEFATAYGVEQVMSVVLFIYKCLHVSFGDFFIVFYFFYQYYCLPQYALYCLV